MGFGHLTTGVKWPGHEVDCSSPFITEVKDTWSYTFAHPIHLLGIVLN